MPSTTVSHITERYGVIAELDRSIIDLIQRRAAAHRELNSLRRAAGVPGVELARENEMLIRYSEALGHSGTSFALLLSQLAGRTERTAGTAGPGSPTG